LIPRLFPILFGAMASTLAIWFAVQLGASINQDWQYAVRWTARVAFLMFLVTYSASSLFRVFPSDMTRALLRRRRYWGLGFAVAHTVHLFAFVTYMQVSGHRSDPVTLIGGGFGYVMLYAMAITSNDWAMERLDRNWKRLHSFGIQTLWLIFVVTYLGRALSPDHQLEGRIALTLAGAALALRFMPRQRRSNAR
jgi:methionine sulfoxide reductase heme-binding subunit